MNTDVYKMFENLFENVDISILYPLLFRCQKRNEYNQTLRNICKQVEQRFE